MKKILSIIIFSFGICLHVASQQASLKGWDDVFNLSVSKNFGITVDKQNKNTVSYYKGNTQGILFDISNNKIQASFSASGKLINSSIVKELIHLTDTNKLLPGVQNKRTFYHEDSISLQLILNKDTVIPDLQTNISVDMLENIFPKFNYLTGKINIQLIVFAPLMPVIAASPQGIIYIVRLENNSKTELKALIGFCDHNMNALTNHSFIALDESATVFLNSGEHTYRSYAMVMGKDANDLQQTIINIKKSSAIDWFNQTRQILKNESGELSIPDDPFYAELFVRAKELVRQSGLYMNNNNWSGGWLGSDYSIWQKENIWTKDNYYEILPLCFNEPQICKDAILFFLQNGLAPCAYGFRKNKFPNPSAITHSLGNAMIPFMLAGAYYQSTADKKYFISHPEILDSAKKRFSQISGTPTEWGICLYPSIQVSDGEARGDFHTGSNLCLWYALKSMSQIAEEIYNNKNLADSLSIWADLIKTDLLKHCSGNGLLGTQFFEGANKDISFISGHDGEESDVSLMPFYGFTEADDNRLIHFSKLAMHPSNPLYTKKIDGIWWYDANQWFPTTFPAWISALSAADSDNELLNRLNKIKKRTDVDGSFWWWTNKYNDTIPENVMRLEGWAPKCGWAAGAYLCHFINDILGLKLDATKNQLSFRPFCPWNDFTWKACKLGNMKFDVIYKKEKNKQTAQITNLNSETFSCTIELMLPENTAVLEVYINGEMTKKFILTERYKRPAILIKQDIAKNKTINFILIYKK